LTNTGHSHKGKKSHVYSPKKRAEIGRLAGQFGPSKATRRKLGYSLNESTACRFKTLYMKEKQKKRLREEPDNITEIPLKRIGQPCY